MTDVFERNERFNRKKWSSREEYEAYCTFRELCWRAVDSRDKTFSIVETQKALGLYRSPSN